MPKGALGAEGQVRITYNQTIGTITVSPTKLAYKGTATASATATSGLPVTFTSLTPSVCTASGTDGSTITSLTLGVCTIAADQVGDSDYTAATQVTQALSVDPCGDGLPLSAGQWQQFALPCVPDASPANIANVLGNSPTANLSAGTYGSQWVLYGRNATNSGNVQLAKTATLAGEAGYWFKSLTAPVDGKLQITVGTATPVETGIDGCQSANGCAVIPVATGTAAARMIGNPFPYHVDWSKVRVRVNGTDL